MEHDLTFTLWTQTVHTEASDAGRTTEVEPATDHKRGTCNTGTFCLRSMYLEREDGASTCQQCLLAGHRLEEEVHPTVRQKEP